jgi:hypothetical protein
VFVHPVQAPEQQGGGAHVGVFPLRAGEAETVIVGLDVEFIAASHQGMPVGGHIGQGGKVAAVRRDKVGEKVIDQLLG